MGLNIYNIFESLILESVGRPQIIDAINNPTRVKISYQGERDAAPKEYVIDPYVYGVSLAGNDIIRAYESKGPSDSKNHDWKTFRVDRILRWEPTKFNLNRQNPVSFNQPTIPDFRLDGGDDKMTSIYAFRKFGDQVKDAKMQQQVDIINKGETPKVPQPINKKITTEPKVKPVEPINVQQKVSPKTQPQPKVEPKANKPLPIKQIKQQPDITAEPDKEAELNKKI